MRFSSTLAASVVLLMSASATEVIVERQAAVTTSTSPSSASTSSSAGAQTVQIVQVSDDSAGLKYYPENIVADPGTFVMFEFYPKNHTVTESLFDHPCVPLAANATASKPDRPGQRSGFMPVAPNLSADQSRPAFIVQINDTKPIWLYCGQGSHCQKGMVMVINENTTSGKTLQKYKDNAALFNVNASVSATGSTSGYVLPTATGASTLSVSKGSSAAITATSSLGAGPSLVSPSSPISTFHTGAAKVAAAVGRSEGAVAAVVALLALI